MQLTVWVLPLGMLAVREEEA